MVFGVLKSVMIMSVFFAILNAIDVHRPFLPHDKIEGSKFYNPISVIAPAIFPILKEGNFGSAFDRFKKKSEPVPQPEEKKVEVTI
jgi:hypothetical protein